MSFSASSFSASYLLLSFFLGFFLFLLQCLSLMGPVRALQGQSEGSPVSPRGWAVFFLVAKIVTLAFVYYGLTRLGLEPLFFGVGAAGALGLVAGIVYVFDRFLRE